MKKVKGVPYEEVLNKLYPTKEARAEFDRGAAKYMAEYRKEVLMETANKIKRARKQRQITQAELAKRLNTNKSVISRIEAGKQNVSVTYLVRVAKALNMQYEIRIY